MKTISVPVDQTQTVRGDAPEIPQLGYPTKLHMLQIGGYDEQLALIGYTLAIIDTALFIIGVIALTS